VSRSSLRTKTASTRASSVLPFSARLQTSERPEKKQSKASARCLAFFVNGGVLASPLFPQTPGFFVPPQQPFPCRVRCSDLNKPRDVRALDRNFARALRPGNFPPQLSSPFSRDSNYRQLIHRLHYVNRRAPHPPPSLLTRIHPQKRFFDDRREICSAPRRVDGLLARSLPTRVRKRARSGTTILAEEARGRRSSEGRKRHLLSTGSATSIIAGWVDSVRRCHEDSIGFGRGGGCGRRPGEG
jgi:hypothetical protein